MKTTPYHINTRFYDQNDEPIDIHTAFESYEWDGDTCTMRLFNSRNKFPFSISKIVVEVVGELYETHNENDTPDVINLGEDTMLKFNPDDWYEFRLLIIDANNDLIRRLNKKIKAITETNAEFLALL